MIKTKLFETMEIKFLIHIAPVGFDVHTFSHTTARPGIWHLKKTYFEMNVEK